MRSSGPVGGRSCAWLGAVAVGVWAALAGGPGVVHAGGQTLRATGAGGTFPSAPMFSDSPMCPVWAVYAAGGTVYVGTDGAAGGFAGPLGLPGDGGVGISTDGGTTFTHSTIANGLRNNHVTGVYAAGDTVYAATLGGLSISTDGGKTFTNRTTADGLGSNNVYWVYAAGGSVYAATDSGVSVSADGGTTFVNRTTADGLGGNTVYGVYAAGGTVYAATMGGVSISTDGGKTFTNRTTADGLGANTGRGVFAVGNIVYAATPLQLFSEPGVGGLGISTNGGKTFTVRTTADGLGDNFVNGVYVAGGTVYAATNGGLSISTDGGTTFTTRTAADGLGNSQVGGVYAVGNTVYAATLGGLGISTDGGTTFTNHTLASVRPCPNSGNP